jgi:two-component system cell cycle response regulator
MRISEKTITVVCSQDIDLLKLIEDLEIEYFKLDDAEFEKDTNFDLVVDLEKMSVMQASDIIVNNDKFSNLLVLSGREISLDERITLASIGVDAISEKGNLLLDLSNFAKNSGNSSKTSIMIIDDSETDLYVLTDTLSGCNFEIHGYLDANEALRKIDAIQPELILVDIHMPSPLNGPCFVRLLRQMPKYASLPVLFVSGEDNEKIKIEALESGADDIIKKPISKELTTRLIHKHIKRSIQQMDQINRDPLTKAYNRNYLNVIKDKLASKGKKYSVAILDIDHFKKLNDNYGHDFGDLALRHMSGLLQRQIRPQDYVFRFGGEEFVLIIDTNDITTSFEIIERLRRQLASSSILNGSNVVKMTFSAGVTMFSGDCFDSALKEADEMLYEAKEQGRNRTIIKK